MKPVRFNYTGWVGLRFQVGATPVEVRQLGRVFVTGNTQSHELRLVQATTKATVASVVWSPAGGVANAITYAPLAVPVTLAANTEYYLAAKETSGGDQWYSNNTAVTTTGVATVLSAVYSSTGSTWLPYGAAGSYTYGPVGVTYCTR